MKKRTKQLIKRVTTGTLAVMLSVTLNFNPLVTIAGAVVDSGIVDKFGVLKDNLIYMSRGGPDTVYADTGDSTPDDSGLNAVLDYLDSMAGWMSSDHDNLGDVLGELQNFHSDNTDENQRMKEVQDSINKNVKDGFSQIHTDIKVFQQSVETHFGIVEQQLSHISEQLDMINENIDSMQHNYRVAHLYSLNSEFETSLWRPYTSEVPYVSDFAQVIGQFANVYTGYWDTSITEMNRPGNSKAKRALEVLGYDAIVRYEGVVLKDETLQSKPIENLTRDLRVSVLGDSISTFAEYTPEEYPDTYPAEDVEEVMQSWWAALIGSMSFQFAANASYSGCYVLPWEGENELTWSGNPDRINALRGGDGSTPDIILVYLGTNDLEGGLEGGRWALTNAEMIGGEEGSFEQYYGDILQTIEQTYPNAYVFCCTITPRTEEGSEEPLTNDADLTYEDYNTVIRSVAVQYQCPIIDFGSAWAVEENMENTFDGVHPNMEGMEKMAEAAKAGIQSAGVLGRAPGTGEIRVMNKPKGQSGEHEGYDMAGNVVPTQLAVLYQEMIPEKNITWLDAVTVLYKAIGQPLYTYQTFSTPNSQITPETSPAYAGFSNIVPDEQGFYNGYDFYMYLNRANTVSGTANNYTMTAIYWQKALNEQFVSARTDMNSEITASEFYILASKMMQAYGEPVINQDEIKALLQVYGSDYPVTLGFEVADAWAYLKVRGCLNVDLVPSGYMDRDDLLDICMCIADPDSRSDYKNISVVLDLGDLLRDDGYYPAYDLDFSAGAFSGTDTYDYTKMEYWTYLIGKVEGFELGETGMLVACNSPNVNDKSDIAFASSSTIKVDDNEFYVVHISAKYGEGQSIFIAMTDAVTNTVISGGVSWIEIPGAYRVGGFYLGGYTRGNGTAVVSMEPGCWKPLDWQSNNKDIIMFADADRAGYNVSREFASNASNASIHEVINYYVDKLFTPMEVMAADNGNDSETSTIAFNSSSNAYDIVESLQKGASSVGLTTAISKDQFVPSGINGIYIAGNAYTLFLNRLWYASNVSGATYVMQKGYNMGQFANGFYKGTSADGVLNVSGTLAGYINSDSTNITPNNLYNLEGHAYNTQARADLSSQAFLLAYALGFNPVPTILVGVDEESQQAWKFRDGINVPASKGNTQLAEDITNILGADYQADNRVKEAIKEYGAKVTMTQNGYKITSSSNAAMADLMGSCSVSDVLKFDANIASTAIMSREEQILLSWEDLLKAGVVYATSDGGQPKRQDDGAYYFMTRNGQVKVNDEKHTIQVGTTLYDLAYNDLKSPKLVYIDNEQHGMIYFDIRCVMGVMTNSFVRNNTKTEALRDSLGQGQYVIYDIVPHGIESDLFTTHDILCFNFPEIPENDWSHELPAGTSSYKTIVMGSTGFDGTTYEADTPGGVQELTYWSDSMKYSRFLLASFVPTANWITVIDDNGSDLQASLFVYYPKVVFEDTADGGGFVDEHGQTPQTVQPPPDWQERYRDLSTKLDEAGGIKNSSNVNFKKMILELYDIESLSSAPWYVQMSIDAVVDLYLMTGKYYISPEYIVREFRISDNSATTVEAWSEYPGVTEESVFSDTSVLEGLPFHKYSEGGNATGAVYWLDGIGYVYNMPSTEEFTLSKYFSGEYALPIAYDYSGKYNKTATLVNFNMNFYGVGVLDGNVEGEVIPYGYVLSDLGYIHYTSTKDEHNVLNGYEIDKLPHIKNGVRPDDGEGTLVYPFRTDDSATSGVRGIKLAPTGIYFSFGGNTVYNTSVSNISNYNTRVNSFFYGASRITLDAVSTNGSTAKFWFVSKLYNPIELQATTEFYRTWKGPASEAWICNNPTIKRAASDDTAQVYNDDWLPTELANWLEGLGSKDIITAIDEGSSWLILIAFWVLPIVGIILMTILVGLSFIGDNKVVQHITEKTFDPVKLLTFGGRDIYHWHWKKVLIPCILLYISFALFLNGNVIRIIMFLAEWYDAIITWSRSVF